MDRRAWQATVLWGRKVQPSLNTHAAVWVVYPGVGPGSLSVSFQRQRKGSRLGKVRRLGREGAGGQRASPRGTRELSLCCK